MRFLVFVLGVALGVAGTLVLLLFRAPPAMPPAPTTAAPSSEPQLSVMLGEQFLTEVIRRSARDMEAGVAGVQIEPDLRVELRDDSVVIHSVAEVLGQKTNATAVLQPVLRDDKLRIDVVRTDVGALPIPAMENVLERAVNARIASLFDGVPVHITGVRVDRVRGLTITGDIRAPATAAAR